MTRVKRIDEDTRSYMSDPDYLALNRTLELIKEERQITEQRAELEVRIARDDEMVRPQVLRRVLSGPIAIS